MNVVGKCETVLYISAQFNSIQLNLHIYLWQINNCLEQNIIIYHFNVRTKLLITVSGNISYEYIQMIHFYVVVLFIYLFVLFCKGVCCCLVVAVFPPIFETFRILVDQSTLKYVL
jgi:hypothetical protein